MGPNTHRADIEGLRAIAVLAVIFYHFDFNLFKGGFVGVDVFFVISGFLITRTIRREFALKTFSFPQFFIRRLRRLFPAFLFVCFLTTVFACVILNPQQINDFGQSLISSLLLSSNIYFFWQSGYFDTVAISKPLLHMWSLSIEEQFYLVYPAILIWILRKSPNRRHLRWIVVFAILMISSTYLVTNHDPATAFFLLPFRFHEFLIGAALTFIALPRLNPIAYDGLFLIGLALIVYASISFTGSTPFPGLYALIPCLGTALVIASGSRTRISLILSNPLFSYVGRISYSAYLVHWPAVVLYMIVTLRPLNLVDRMILLALTLGISSAIYAWVENIFRSQEKTYSDAAVVKFARVGTAFMLTLALFLSLSDGFVWRYPTDSREFLAGQAGLKNDLFYGGAACLENRRNSSCKMGAGRTILTIGDSHAEMLFAGLADEATKTARSVQLFSAGSCPLFSVEATAFGGKPCRKARNSLLEYLSAANNVANIDVLVISQRWWLFRTDEPSNELFVASVLRKIDEFTKQHQITAPIIVIGQVPEVAQYGGVYECIGRPPYLSSMGDCSYSSMLVSNVARNHAINLEFSKQISSISSSKQISFFDPFSKLCDKDRCRQIDSDLGILYSDGDHLSHAGSRYLAPFALKSATPKP